MFDQVTTMLTTMFDQVTTMCSFTITQKVEQPTQPVSTLCLTGKHLLLLGDFAEKKTHLVGFLVLCSISCSCVMVP